MADTATLEIILKLRDELSKALSGAGSSLKGFGQQATKIGKGLTAGLTLPIVGIGVAAVKTAADFEAQLRIMEIAARGSGVAIDELSDYALKMGAETVFSASEAADSMTALFKAGMNATEVMGDMTGESGALKAAMDLAAASNLSLAQAADMVSVSIATFGIETDKASSIADSFVKAADASVAEVGDLTAALENIGPIAAGFGFTLEDTNTALAILSEYGVRGAEAGTALRSMLVNIMRPTDAVTEAMGELGVELYDAEGTMKSLPDIIDNLSRALYATGPVTRAVGGATEDIAKAADKAAKAIPGLTNRVAEQQVQLKILQQELATTVEEYGAGSLQVEKKELAIAKLTNRLAENQTALGQHGIALKAMDTAQVETITGVRDLTEEQRNQYVQTIAGTYGMKAMNALLLEGKVGWDEMTTAIGGAATAQEIAETRMDTFQGAMESLRGSIETFMIQVGTPLINDFVRPLVEWLTETINKLGELDPKIIKWGIAISGVLAALGPLLIIVGQIAIAISALSPILGVVGGALALLTGPIGLVVAAIALLAVAWAKDWGGIREKTQEVVDKIKLFITNLRLDIETLVYNMKDDIERIKTFFVDLRLDLEVFIYNLPNYIEDIKTFFRELPGKIWDAVKDIGTSIINGIREGLASAWPQLKKDIENIANAVVEAFKEMIGFGSPSTVFIEIGASMRQGLLQGFAGDFGGFIQSFQAGGIVPGRGPRLAMVHGGERITPVGGRGKVVIEVPVYLDGREIARVVDDRLADRLRAEGITL